MRGNEEAERTELQREKERERRRMRDRERRQKMSGEQRERHLARRRRNYQLRRIRAHNAKLLHSQHTNTNTNSASVFSLDLSHGAQHLRKMPRRLRVSHIRLLARRLHGDGHHQFGTTNDYVATKRLGLIQVKRLARALKL